VPDPSTHRKTLAEHVEGEGLKWTRQRQAVLDAFLRSRGHLTVEDIHRNVARTQPRISLATVYRTMKLFAEAGIASERHFQDGITRFEVRQPHHDHLICQGCGRIVEFESDEIERLQEEVAREHGFSLRSHRHELYGECRSCR
jgi:Fur family ferric uptake transcriptional regulator